MIFKDSFEAIVEALYLEETLGKEVGKTDIKVNPRNNRLEIDYTFNKTIILTDQYVEQGAIESLLKNNNKVLSRIQKYSSIPGVLFQPYITYVNFKVMWSGETLECPEEIKNNSRRIFEWIGDYDSFECDPDKTIELYFPKILGIGEEALYDSSKNITSLGWLMHQIGINTDLKTRFNDLDLVKTKKIIR